MLHSRRRAALTNLETRGAQTPSPQVRTARRARQLRARGIRGALRGRRRSSALGVMLAALVWGGLARLAPGLLLESVRVVCAA